MNEIPVRAASVGSLMAIASMSCVQLGLAASIGLAGTLGADGVAWLRLAWAAVIIAAIARPWRLRLTGPAVGYAILPGLAMAGMTLAFMRAVQTIPLGTASALEFTGPLVVALVQGRGAGHWWALVAAAGVLGLTEPWHGATDLTGVLYALAGDAIEGLGALAISMPVAAVAATFVVGPAALAGMDLSSLGIGFGLALLLSVIPFSLELLALRRLTTSTFGTLMCLEPAIALGVGLVLLHQVPRPAAIAGIVLVVVAGIGATRTGRREPSGNLLVQVDAPGSSLPS